MKRALFVLVAFGWVVTASCSAQSSTGRTVELKTCTDHPMQYFVSLPEGWSRGKSWPVVIVVESADREFAKTAEEFEKERSGTPFIIATPLVVTNGGANVRNVPTYHYAESVWSRIEAEGPWTFDRDGIAAMIKDIGHQYGGEDKVFMTGFEAGGHTVWAETFQRPEMLRAVALVCPNFLGRHMNEGLFSQSPARATLPIKVFFGSEDALAQTGQPIRGQWDVAAKAARDHGFEDVTYQSVAGKGHDHLAAEVLLYFHSLLKANH
jgi:poly(3-hydroxybutyrate) depolymerase